MLAFFNTQTLALLAVAIGFVVLCLGLWYLWTNHAQLRTEVQLLRSQQQSNDNGAGGYQALDTSPSGSSSPVPVADTADITALMSGQKENASICTMPSDVRVCRMPSSSAAAAHVVHRTDADDDEGSDTSASEYDDDDEDITDEDEEGETEADATNPSYEVVTAADANGVSNVHTSAPNDAQPPVDLVESLLSSMVTNAIDGSVELQGGATVIMSCVDVADEHDQANAKDVTVEDVTEDVEAASVTKADDEVVLQEIDTVDTTTSTKEDNDATSALDAGATAFADELRSHTVAQLKVICQEHQLGVRRANGSSKRKDELVADLVAALYASGDDNENDAQDTASNESTNTAGA